MANFLSCYEQGVWRAGRGITRELRERATEMSRTYFTCVVIVMKQRLEAVVVHDAAAPADLLRDTVGPFPPLPIGGNVTPRHKGEGFGWEYESGQWLLTLAGAQPGKSVSAPFLAANAMMDSEKALGIVFLLHGGQPEIV